MLSWIANKSIKHGYSTHRAGKITKRTGLGVAGVGLAGAGVHGGATFLSTGGRDWGALGDMGGEARHLWRISNIEHRVPVARFVRTHAEPYFSRASEKLSRWARNRSLNRLLAKKPNRAARVVDIAESLRIPAHSARLLKIGSGIALAGYGVEKIGGAMIRHGYRSHPALLKRKARRFFGLKAK